MDDLKWNFFFGTTVDGRVIFRTTDLDTGYVVGEMILPPKDADNIADALKAHAERARRSLAPATAPPDQQEARHGQAQ